MLYIISAPSGAGKTSLVRALAENVDNLVISVSHTTRARREGEIEGINYHFVSPEEFKKLIKQDNFLEYAQVFGLNQWYGTSKTWVSAQIQQEKEVILEIDWQGAQQIRKIFPQNTSIFILPPSLEVLQKRLEDRAKDSPEMIEKRMQAAKSECSHLDEFDYLVVNDVFETAVQELEIIIRAARLRVNIQQRKCKELIQRLAGA